MRTLFIKAIIPVVSRTSSLQHSSLTNNKFIIVTSHHTTLLLNCTAAGICAYPHSCLLHPGLHGDINTCQLLVFYHTWISDSTHRSSITMRKSSVSNSCARRVSVFGQSTTVRVMPLEKWLPLAAASVTHGQVLHCLCDSKWFFALSVCLWQSRPSL